ncbi:hypothetical protein A3740_18530 [Oleiphilus sp. HI0068]|uniref:hypothetical protein n=1 Tax=unclassified Oleiphilus TaxID=2631174 RepID=UPI0007C253EF|nr:MULTISPECIES: hypothetical protein [unclassified Oleiphilus]KZY73656.1 hypothetical protein A3740_18530 [Oleiphilus sp. HI0068]KZY80537.1 hypothetical protein A3741_18635 [Oleiphilus sp. HI0069]KZY57428.1 hypothetical protein A3735_18595 [Oleiphilus sp. HI0061]KZY81009.1 hypothetical protein A3741_18095 [Oleiphilus sp. HI0069]KZZ75324.1 hypothetical protein A3766_17010 [Oleiphilus sp. HI0132]
MENKELNQVLGEIRDELKEMNSQFKWLVDQAKDTIENDIGYGDNSVKVAEIENRKSKREITFAVIFIVGLFGWLALKEYGYL